MKRLELLPAIFLMMFVFSCTTCFAEVVTDSAPKDGVPNGGSPPKIQFDEKVYDLGKVYQHKSLSHIFTFRNIGTGILRIEKVKAG